MFGLHILDIIVIVVYLLAMAYIGLMAYKKVHDTGSFFMGGRKFGKVLTVSHALGAGTHTDQPVAVTGATYEIGLAGIWWQFLWLFVTPFYWLLAPIFRRMRYLTVGDFFENRYGPMLGIIYGILGLLFFVFNEGIMLKGTGLTIEAVTDGAISTELAIFAMTAIFVSYGLAGGLVAAVVTDFIQGLFIVVLSFILLPFAITKAGGFAGLHDKLDPEMFSMVAPKEMTLLVIVMISINALIGIVVQPHMMAVMGSGRTERDCRTGVTYGNFVKRACTVGWALTGIAAAVLYPSLEHREMAFGVAVVDLLPIGLVGLMIAAMLAAVMSTCDAFMVDGAALFVQNFYQPYFKKEASEKHYLLVGRIAALVVVAGGIFFALWLPSVVKGLEIMWKATAYLGIAFWGGVISRRTNRWGALAGFVVAFALATWAEAQDYNLGEQILIYLTGGFMAMIVVSLLTKPEPQEKTDQFFTLLHTPVEHEDALREAGIEMVYEGEKH